MLPFIFALTNYQLAKFIQKYFLSIFPNLQYELALVVPWLAIALAPALLNSREAGLHFDYQKTKQNMKPILVIFALTLIGLAVFWWLGFTRYFHNVKYPWLFFLATPIIEEILFRGWIYSKTSLFWSAVLFGLHHLQYFNYMPTKFALFQITYTIGLGLILGKLRKTSGSIYVSSLLHIILNYVSYKF